MIFDLHLVLGSRKRKYSDRKLAQHPVLHLEDAPATDTQDILVSPACF